MPTEQVPGLGINPVSQGRAGQGRAGQGWVGQGRAGQLTHLNGWHRPTVVQVRGQLMPDFFSDTRAQRPLCSLSC